MPPSLALVLWFVLVLALLRFDPAREPRTSWAMWVPLIWIFIVGSRLPSQWLGGGFAGAAESMEQGNGVDRTIYSILILLALGILMSRSFEWGKFLRANAVLTAFLSFCLMSVLWSDFPLVAFKRWFRDMGNYLVVLVALSDPRPLEAVRTLLRRFCFLLIPLSILLNKYFEGMSRAYDMWTGQGYFVGASTSKNLLGLMCLVSALYFFWDTFTRWAERKDRRTKRIIGVNLALFAMTLSLLAEAGSATSNVCLVIGCAVIAASHSRAVRRRPALVTVLVPVGISAYLILQFGFGIDIMAQLAEAVGRKPDLTGRTYIWGIVLSTNTNPIIGIGYSSFWLGERLLWVWERTGAINEAHNGYLEVYLNLGVIGLALILGFMVASYRTICKRFRASASRTSLTLALWTILLFYNVTESAFSPQLLWIVYLMGVLIIPGRRKQPSPQSRLLDAHVSTVHKGVTA